MLNDIHQLEVWTDQSGIGNGWFADYIIVKNNQTDEEACFPVHEYLNIQNGGVKDNHLILEKEQSSISCRDRDQMNDEDDSDTVKTRPIKFTPTTRDSSNDSSTAVVFKRTYHVDTKTGNFFSKIVYIFATFDDNDRYVNRTKRFHGFFCCWHKC